MKQFVLGIGAQKAGTTWLYKYVSADRAFRQGVVKNKAVGPALFRAPNIPVKWPQRGPRKCNRRS